MANPDGGRSSNGSHGKNGQSSLPESNPARRPSKKGHSCQSHMPTGPQEAGRQAPTQDCCIRIEALDANHVGNGLSCAYVDVGFDMRRDGAPVFVHPNTRSAIYDHPLGGLAKVTGTAAEIALVLRGAGYDVDTRHGSGGGS